MNQSGQTVTIRQKFSVFPPLGALALLAGCSGNPNVKAPQDLTGYYGPQLNQGGTVFGDQGLSFGIGHNQNRNGPDNSGVLGVNAFLWRGALDTLSFMPLASADPFGGVIITDWYSPPGVNSERFKATAYILGRQLRSDGVRVTVFRQLYQDGQWQDAPVSAVTVGDIENKILDRARQLRVQTASE